MDSILVGGAPACGKTSFLLHVLDAMIHSGGKPAVCKIDCLKSGDEGLYRRLQVPVVQGLCGSLCPDHYLAVNLPDIHQWALEQGATCLFIETAGLCNRCAPFTDRTANVCVIDSLGSIRGPEKLGPLVTTADLLIMTKCDMISQAEREVLAGILGKLNPHAELLEANGLSGQGTSRFLAWLKKHAQPAESLEGSQLLHSMPAGTCAYCVGETRIGQAFAQGILSKMVF
ncbi:MAG: Ni2+-binding GTPase [Paenibacillaceae bacterium]|nr:Ni2+-binding GTPase [Paenibacillaceae bacterium]